VVAESSISSGECVVELVRVRPDVLHILRATFPLLGIKRPGALVSWGITVARTFSLLKKWNSHIVF